MVIFDAIHWGNNPNVEDEIPPRVVVLELMLSIFGPLPPGLRDHIKESPAKWVVSLMIAALWMKNGLGGYIPSQSFPLRKNQDCKDPSDKEFIERILNLNPKLRPSA